ncbi:MAG: hypothetical protein ACE37F_20695 [Nannocystaceae bacterium]|nr:hypothetical protein [bacterium]
MNKNAMRWVLTSGLVATGLGGCADPCSDDGLLQDDVSECPAVTGGSDSDTETSGETESASDTETASDSNSDTLETDSAGGADCNDGMQNGDETDVDCGGSCDEKCDDGEGCMVDDDCMSDACGDDDTCQSTDTDSDTDGDPTCEDGMQNGDETDVDCGNSCGATCEDGEGCDDGEDCVSGECDPRTMTCTSGEPVTYCDDVDEDSFGDPDSCVDVEPGDDPPDGSVPNNEDCADDNANAFPGAAENEPELCAEDEDDDGWGDNEPPKGVDPGSDCLDTNANAHPGVADQKGDACVLDEDGDGYGDVDPPDGVDPGTDCVDTEADIYPGAAELEPTLCTADIDDDGYGSDSATDISPDADNGTDCADDNANAFPGSAPNDSPTACLEDEDDDDYGDADPPEGVDAGSDCNDMDAGVPFVVEGVPDDCPTAELLDGSLGCEFFAMPLANDIDGDPVYQLLLANAHPVNTASVTVEELIGGVWTPVVGPLDIAPQSQSIQSVAYNASNSTAISVGGAYRIVSDFPIAAYQASISTFTSDASLLIPTASWDNDYDVVGYDGINAAFGEYFAVVAAEDGTEVTVNPSQLVLGGGGVPLITAGGTATITLDEGDTVVMMSAGTNATSAASLSGTTISATAPIGVFTGTECSNVPGGTGACDHLEDMHTPSNTSSNTVVASRMPARDVDIEAAIWQVYAVEDANITFDALPGVTGLPAAPVALAAGESLELSVAGTAAEPGDFVAESDAPIIVSQYLAGAGSVGTVAPGSASGDPAQVLMPGASQLLEAYVVSTVSGNVANHLTITRQVGSGDIDLDGGVVAAGDFFAINADWEVARVPVAEGVHVLTSDDPFAVVVSGYNNFNSYAYLGGGQARALVCE